MKNLKLFHKIFHIEEFHIKLSEFIGTFFQNNIY